MLVGLNYSAYSQRALDWINPEALMNARDELNNLLTSATSVSVNATEELHEEAKDDLFSVTSKIRATDPAVIYAREYKAE